MASEQADLRSDIQILRDEFLSVNTELRSEITELRSRTVDLENQVNELQSENTDLRSRTVDLENHAAVAAGYMENAFEVHTQYQQNTTQGEVSKALNATIVSCIYMKSYPSLFPKSDKIISLHEIEKLPQYRLCEKNVNHDALPLSRAKVLARKLKQLSKSCNDQNHLVIPTYKPILRDMINNLVAGEEFEFGRNALLKEASKRLENKLKLVPLSKPPTKPAKRARLSLQPVTNSWNSPLIQSN